MDVNMDRTDESHSNTRVSVSHGHLSLVVVWKRA